MIDMLLNPLYKTLADQADNELNPFAERYQSDLNPEFLQKFAELIIESVKKEYNHDEL